MDFDEAAALLNLDPALGRWHGKAVDAEHARQRAHLVNELARAQNKRFARRVQNRLHELDEARRHVLAALGPVGAEFKSATLILPASEHPDSAVVWTSRPAGLTEESRADHQDQLGRPYHAVGSSAILFCAWLTRVQDFRAFAEASERPWRAAPFPQADDHPAVNVSWHDAREFCAWLTECERASGALPAKARFRLPTDVEWSSAVGLEETPRGIAEAAPPPKARSLSVG